MGFGRLGSDRQCHDTAPLMVNKAMNMDKNKHHHYTQRPAKALIIGCRSKVNSLTTESFNGL